MSKLHGPKVEGYLTNKVSGVSMYCQRNFRSLIGLAFIAAIPVLVRASDDVALPRCAPASSPKPAVIPKKSTDRPDSSFTVYCGSNTIEQNGGPQAKAKQPKEGEEPSTVQLLEVLVKLLSSLAWPVVTLFVVIRFRRQLAALIDRIKSIEIGSNKLILDREMQPATLEQETAKADEEAKEALYLEPAETTRAKVATEVPAEQKSPQLASGAEQVKDFRRRAFLAEDLALRALQIEYLSPIRRQVTAGSNFVFDGAFELGGRLYIVEVKHYRSTFSPDRLRTSLSRITDHVHSKGWKNVQIILAVVFEELDDADLRTQRLVRATSSISLPVIVRCFSLSGLQQRFAADPGDTESVTRISENADVPDALKRPQDS